MSEANSGSDVVSMKCQAVKKGESLKLGQGMSLYLIFIVTEKIKIIIYIYIVLKTVSTMIILFIRYIEGNNDND